MPLVAYSELPTFRELRARGHDVLPLEEALHQDIRELRIGLLNMMPDAALAATDRQFMRLVGGCNRIVQLYVYPFSVAGLPRSEEAQTYIDEHYADFAELRAEGLDALIISGANVTNPSLDLEPFWQPLREVVAWAKDNVTSILCSCLATHALLKHIHRIERRRMPRKQWGVYSHRVVDRSHPLLREINTRFDVPHSRWNEVAREELEAAGLRVLVESDDGHVHMAVSPDGIRVVYLQGHPEYDHHSLLKEYKRETKRFLAGEIDEPSPYPENYLSSKAIAICEAHLEQALRARAAGSALPPFPDDDLEPHLENTWGDTGRAIFNNWLGLVYRLTSVDQHELFKPGIDPEDPLGLRSSSDS